MLHDISPPISPKLAVWPGDTPPSREVLMEIERGDTVTLSTLRATVHLGAHADAPNHYALDGDPIDRVGLDPYLGPCRVVKVDVPAGSLIRPDQVPDSLAEPRVLFRTDSVPDAEAFREDFAAFAPEAIDKLASLGVRLVGIDTPSVDPFSSKTLDSHRALHRHGLAVLEGLVLSAVPEGVYELIALPLKLVGFDASPVRAVLRSLASEGNP